MPQLNDIYNNTFQIYRDLDERAEYMVTFPMVMQGASAQELLELCRILKHNPYSEEIYAKFFTAIVLNEEGILVFATKSDVHSFHPIVYRFGKSGLVELAIKIEQYVHETRR